MDIGNFKPSEKRLFTIDSGKLLIADSYELGYPKNIKDEIEVITNTKLRVIYLLNGVLYRYPEDSLWDVYRMKNGLWIKRNNSNTPIENDKEFLFTASTDVCTLLVGDQKVFGIPETEFTLPPAYKPLIKSKEDIQRHNEYARQECTSHHSQIAEIQPGKYSCKSKWNGLEVNLL